MADDPSDNTYFHLLPWSHIPDPALTYDKNIPATAGSAAASLTYQAGTILPDRMVFQRLSDTFMNASDTVSGHVYGGMNVSIDKRSGFGPALYAGADLSWHRAASTIAPALSITAVAQADSRLGPTVLAGADVSAGTWAHWNAGAAGGIAAGTPGALLHTGVDVPITHNGTVLFSLFGRAALGMAGGHTDPSVLGGIARDAKTPLGPTAIEAGIQFNGGRLDSASVSTGALPVTNTDRKGAAAYVGIRFH